MGLFKAAEKLIALISTLVLARLLVPEDFGLIAMGMSVVALTDLMNSFGFDTTLIQKQDANRTHFDTAWTYSVCLGLGVALLIVALAHPASLYFRDERLFGILLGFAVASAIQGFENIGVVVFRKSLDFRSDFYLLLSKKFAGFAVTLIAAIVFRSYWALVAGAIFGRTAGVVISYWIHPYRPKFSLAGGRDLFVFSKWLVLNNFVHFLESRSVDYILGRGVGAVSVGIFGVAQQLASMPSTELVAPLNRAALPAYSQVASDRVRLKHEALRVIGMISLLIFPLAAGLASLAEPVIYLMLGQKWIEVIPLLQVLSIYGIVIALHSNINQVYLALGVPRVITLVSVGMVAFLIPLLVVNVAKFGVLGAAWTFMVYAIVATPIVHGVFFRLLNVRPTQYLKEIWRPLLAAIFMVVSIKYCDVDVYANQSSILVLLLLVKGILIGAASYLLSVAALWYLSGSPDGAESTVFELAARAKLALRR